MHSWTSSRYLVRVVLKESSETINQSGLTENGLTSQIAGPYQQNQNFLLDGREIIRTNIKQIRVWRYYKDDMLLFGMKKIPSIDEILSRSEEVTPEYIKLGVNIFSSIQNQPHSSSQADKTTKKSDTTSFLTLLNILAPTKIRSYLKYKSKKDINSEADFHQFLYPILKSHYYDLKDKETLPAFGFKSFIPDFGIDELGLLIELKYIADNTSVKDIQEQMHADVPGYLKKSSYTKVIFILYDAANKIKDARPLDDLKRIEGVEEVLYVPGIG